MFLLTAVLISAFVLLFPPPLAIPDPFQAMYSLEIG